MNINRRLIRMAVKKKKANAKAKPKAKKVKKAKKAAKPKVKKEKLFGKIDHYFDKISVAAMKLTAPIKVGDKLHIKGHTTDFDQVLTSMQIDHVPVMKAKKGQEIGFKVKEYVRDNDGVYLKK
jgi:hypothetical protein